LGIDSNNLKGLLLGRNLGVNFERTCTIGRQFLYLSPNDMKQAFKKFGLPTSDSELHGIFRDCKGYADGLFCKLGAKTVDSFDASSYEGASVIHDLNTPISQDYLGKFSVVVDSGSLEHIFNVPVAIKNCLDMVEVGGYYLAILPANNFLGHGFYQFSPELFFSLLTSEQGYDLKRLAVFEVYDDAPWYTVTKPGINSDRVELVNSRPVHMFILARKISEVPASFTVQQSDYKSRWKDESEADSIPHRRTWRQFIPKWLRRLLSGVRMHFSPFRSPSYRQIDIFSERKPD